MTSSETVPRVGVGENADAMHSGAILLVPPPPYPLIEKSRFRPTLGDPNAHIRFYVRSVVVNVKAGPTVHRHATALEPRTYDAPYAAPDMLEQLAEIGARFSNRSFQGHIEAVSVEDGRRWRYIIGPGGAPSIVRPEIVYRWPGELDVTDIRLSTMAQEALGFFARHPGVSMCTTEAAAHLSRSVSTLSTTLNHLQGLGLLRGVYENTGPGIGVRRHPYTVTAKGLAWKPR